MDGEGFIPVFAGSLMIPLGFQTHCFASSYILKSMKDPSRSKGWRQQHGKFDAVLEIGSLNLLVGHPGDQYVLRLFEACLVSQSQLIRPRLGRWINHVCIHNRRPHVDTLS
jgi:hypothetical protein